MPLLSEAKNESDFGIKFDGGVSNNPASNTSVQPTYSTQATGPSEPIRQVPPSPPTGIDDPNPEQLPPVPAENNPTVQANVTALDDLYPTAAAAEAPETPTVATPEGASVADADLDVGNVAAPGQAEAKTEGLLSQAERADAAQTDLTPDQQVDQELARILGQDSPLMARARAEAQRTANARGLQNTSIAAGMTQGAMVDRALPMAQQNAAQNFQREASNTEFRQQAGLFNAEQRNRLAALEAELGTNVSVFNAEQLNQAERLTAQLRTAVEQGNQDAANRAAMQLAELQRSAEAQQADIDFTAEQQRADAVNQQNRQIVDAVTRLNEQYLRGSQAVDLATVQGTYQQIIETNRTAGTLNQQFLDSIGQIMSNKDMTPAQIASAVNNLQRGLEASLRLIAEINDMDFETSIGDVGGGAGGGGGGGGRRYPGTEYR